MTTQIEIAEALDLTPAAVSQWAKKGMPTSSVEDAKAWRDANVRKRPKRGQVEQAVATQKTANALPATTRRDDVFDGESATSWDEARRRREVAEAQLAEIKLSETMGDLIRVSEVKAALAGKISSMREAFLQIPSRLVPVLVAESDPVKIHRLLEDELNTALKFVAGSSIGGNRGRS